jgi:hypothetical protein
VSKSKIADAEITTKGSMNSGLGVFRREGFDYLSPKEEGMRISSR